MVNKGMILTGFLMGVGGSEGIYLIYIQKVFQPHNLRLDVNKTSFKINEELFFCLGDTLVFRAAAISWAISDCMSKMLLAVNARS